MGTSSTNLGIVLFVLAVLAGSIAAVAQTGAARVNGTVLDPQGHPVATSDKAYPPQLSGTVVDTSGAGLPGLPCRFATRTVLSRERHSRTETAPSFFLDSRQGIIDSRYLIPVLKPKKSLSP